MIAKAVLSPLPLPPIDMGTTLQLPEQTEVAYFTQGAILGAGVNLDVRDDGSALLTGLKIFRTGKLTDSAGRTRQWTHDDLDAAVENFGLLREELPNVPMRSGHTRHPDSVVGYYTAIRREGEFLIGDFEVTEPDAVKKIQRKTYRSRSMEIGAFDSDTHGLCWPVAMGLAFVDIPAVSGLYEAGDRQFHVITPGERNMPQPNDQTLFAAYYAQGLADAQSHFEANPPKPPEFACFGAKTVDPAAVQAHIVALETFQAETVTNARKDFVAGLVKDNKILAPQAEHFEKLALSMSVEQFESFTKGYESAPTNPLLSQFNSGPGAPAGAGSAGGGTETSPVIERIATLNQIHEFHRQGGMTDPQIQTLDSYAELQKLLGQTGK